MSDLPEAPVGGEPEHVPGLTFGEAWDIQHSVGPSLGHDPKCSSVPGHHPLSGGHLLCDCGAVDREWKRRHATPPAELRDFVGVRMPAERPTPITDAARLMAQTVLGRDIKCVELHVAQDLERQLAEMRESIPDGVLLHRDDNGRITIHHCGDTFMGTREALESMIRGHNDLIDQLAACREQRDAMAAKFTKLDKPKYSGDPMMDTVLATPNPEFRAWAESLPATYWTRYDLSAARIGWEAALAAVERSEA